MLIRRWGERPNERVEIGWVLLASATSGLVSIQSLPTAPLLGGVSSSVVRASDWYSEGPGFNPQLGPWCFLGFLYSLRKLNISKSLQYSIELCGFTVSESC